MIGNRGFSISEILVVSALLGVTALGLMQTTQNQSVTQKQTDTALEVTNVSNAVSQLLLDKKSCKKTLDSVAIANDATLDSIRNWQGREIFRVSSEYGQGLLKITGMKLTDVQFVGTGQRYESVNIKIELEKLSNVIRGNKRLSKDFPLSIELDASDNLLQCYASMQDTVAKSVEQACGSVDGTFDGSAQICRFLSPLKEKPCEARRVFAGVRDTGDPACAKSPLAGKRCLSGVLRGFSVDGDPVCVPTPLRGQKCSGGKILYGIAGDGTLKCRAPAGGP